MPFAKLFSKTGRGKDTRETTFCTFYESLQQSELRKVVPRLRMPWQALAQGLALWFTRQRAAPICLGTRPSARKVLKQESSVSQPLRNDTIPCDLFDTIETVFPASMDRAMQSLCSARSGRKSAMQATSAVCHGVLQTRGMIPTTRTCTASCVLFHEVHPKESE